MQLTTYVRTSNSFIKVNLMIIFKHNLETSNSQPGAGVINYSSRHPLGVAGYGFGK